MRASLPTSSADLLRRRAKTALFLGWDTRGDACCRSRSRRARVSLAMSHGANPLQCAGGQVVYWIESGLPELGNCLSQMPTAVALPWPSKPRPLLSVSPSIRVPSRLCPS